MARETRVKRRRPATSPDEREQQLAGMAYDLAEEQFEAGTASSQVITHFLKAGSTRERLEQEKIRGEITVARVKAEQLEGQKRVEALFGEALDAFRGYQGLPPADQPEMEGEEPR